MSLILESEKMILKRKDPHSLYLSPEICGVGTVRRAIIRTNELAKYFNRDIAAIGFKTQNDLVFAPDAPPTDVFAISDKFGTIKAKGNGERIVVPVGSFLAHVFVAQGKPTCDFEVFFSGTKKELRLLTEKTLGGLPSRWKI